MDVHILCIHQILYPPIRKICMNPVIGCKLLFTYLTGVPWCYFEDVSVCETSSGMVESMSQTEYVIKMFSILIFGVVIVGFEA